MPEHFEHPYLLAINEFGDDPNELTVKPGTGLSRNEYNP
jgi:hypothetical protein